VGFDQSTFTLCYHKRETFFGKDAVMTKRVLFVCMGNICRSPAGEAVMKRFAEEFRVDVEVDSAGTHDYHIGKPADPRMIAAAEARGYELTSRGRQVTPADLKPGRFDLVLAMDAKNHAILQEMAGGIKPHIRLFGDYLDEEWPDDVPDPYYGDEAGFDKVLDMLEEGCPIILATLMGEDIFADEFDE
jgi:protein-tyrosine phosphatase